MNETTSSSSFSPVPEKLVARVKFINKTNAKANLLATELRKAFAPFVGKKVRKVDMYLLASVKSIIEPIIDKYRNTNTQIWFNACEYGLKYGMRCSFRNDLYSFSKELRIYVGGFSSTEKQVLGEISLDKEMFKTDFSAEQIHAAREKLYNLEKEVQNLKDEISTFGTNDHDYNCN